MPSTVIKPPKTYSEWVTALDILKAKTDDEEVLSAIQNGSIEWQSGVAERFTGKLSDVINHRMNAAIDKFGNEISRSGGQERCIVQALLSIRKELRFLSKAVNIRAIPETTRNQFCDIVLSQAKNVQTSLEDSAKLDRTGKLASIVRNNRVDAF